LGEVARQHFGFGRRSIGEAVAQDFGDAPVQNLAAAFQKILISRVLDQRVLEAIV
jgi:hypothetical protein